MPDTTITGSSGLLTAEIKPRRETYYLVTSDNLADIRSNLESLESIKDVHDLHVWCVTSGVHALSAHIRIEEGADAGKVLETITSYLRERYRIDHSTIQLEPPSFTHQALHF